jgi:hypothetical protein
MDSVNSTTGKPSSAGASATRALMQMHPLNDVSNICVCAPCADSNAPAQIIYTVTNNSDSRTEWRDGSDVIHSTRTEPNSLLAVQVSVGESSV